MAKKRTKSRGRMGRPPIPVEKHRRRLIAFYVNDEQRAAIYRHADERHMDVAALLRSIVLPVCQPMMSSTDDSASHESRV
jgi:hypothetical protein